jgi:hypothetical protein
LSAWRMRVTTGDNYRTVTVTSDSSASAISCVLGVMRGVEASGFDKNPAVLSDNTSPYDGPLSTTLTQANEVVIGYFGLQGPSAFDFTAWVNTGYTQGAITDAITSGASDSFGVAAPEGARIGVAGTTGGADNTNTTTALTQRVVSATTSVAPQITNTTANRTGLAGTVTFKIGAATDMDLDVSDFVAVNREYYSQTQAASCVASGACTGGVGQGTFAQLPTSCTVGVAFWVTDRGGDWNTLGGGANDGALYKCTDDSPLTWTLFYTPATYPHAQAAP